MRDGSADLLLAVTVGNTRARWGVFRGRELAASGAGVVGGPEVVASAAADALEGDAPDRVVVASVNHPAARGVASAIEHRLGSDGGWSGVEWVGQDLLPPMRHSLDDASTLGADRVLCAFAAWRRARQACVVIDAGTAITIDFVDGEGTFCGGAISPGLAMMMRALHEHTSALPLLDFEPPDASRGPFGGSTADAMRLGVLAAARGAARECIDRYAEAFGAYPRVIATGGDAAALFEGDDLIEQIVPDLQLMGIRDMLDALEEGR